MKKQLIRLSVGTDISQKDFKACIKGLLEDHHDKVIASRTFKNKPSGFEEFWKWVSKHCDKFDLEVAYIMEATGVYHENLAWFLHEKGQSVAIVLGNQSKAFMKSEGIKTKNDKIDAKGLAQMGLSKRLRSWKPGSVALHQLRTQTRHYARMQNQRTRLKNQLHALEHSHQPDSYVIKQLKVQIKILEKQIEQIKQYIEKTVRADGKLSKKIDHLLSIKGVGLLSAITVVAETGGFELFTSIKQLTSYAGYDIVENQSGKHKGKTRISKKGNTFIRRILFMPAFNAIKKEGICKDLYERIFERSKIKMKAYTAVQRKLLCLMYTLWKKEEDFKPNYTKENFVEEQNALLHEIA